MVALATTGLLTTLLPVIGPVGAAHAADCLTEGAGSGQGPCDDVSAPDTRFTSVSPQPKSVRYCNTGDIDLSFSGSYADGDTDPLRFECQVFTTIEPVWSACTSPLLLRDLADSTDSAYTVRVRAIDSTDAAIPFLPSDQPDLDASPATVRFFVDTTTPDTMTLNTLVDPISPAYPLNPSQRLSVNLYSDEDDALFACFLGRERTPCEAGMGTIAVTTPGDQTLSVFAYDRAGNVDQTPTTTRFSVPTNLTPKLGKHWRYKREPLAFGGEFLKTNKSRAKLSIRATNAKDIRVLAPTGLDLAKIDYRIGKGGRWQTLPQNGSPSPLMVFALGRFPGGFTGPVSFRVGKVKKGQSAQLDAILIH